MLQPQAEWKGSQGALPAELEKTGWICGHLRVVCVTFDGGLFEDHGI